MMYLQFSLRSIFCPLDIDERLALFIKQEVLRGSVFAYNRNVFFLQKFYAEIAKNVCRYFTCGSHELNSTQICLLHCIQKQTGSCFLYKATKRAIYISILRMRFCHFYTLPHTTLKHGI